MCTCTRRHTPTPHAYAAEMSARLCVHACMCACTAQMSSARYWAVKHDQITFVLPLILPVFVFVAFDVYDGY